MAGNLPPWMAEVEVPQELGHSVLGERPAHDGALALLEGDGGQGRVPEAPHAQRALQLRLGHGFRPDVAPTVVLVLLTNFLQYFNVSVATGSLEKS